MEEKCVRKQKGDGVGGTGKQQINLLVVFWIDSTSSWSISQTPHMQFHQIIVNPSGIEEKQEKKNSKEPNGDKRKGVFWNNFSWSKHYRKDHELLNPHKVQRKAYFFNGFIPLAFHLVGWKVESQELLGIESVPENHAITDVTPRSLIHMLGKPSLTLKLYFLSALELNLALSIHLMVGYFPKILFRGKKP